MIGEIIPVVKVIKANKILKEKNTAQDFEIPENIEEIDIKYLEEDYKSELEAKNRFEDKAKTIIAALTIAITLILNLSKIIEAIASKYDLLIIEWMIFILAILAIVYMLVAGIMSIQVLIKENLLYSITLTERTEQNKEKIYIKTRQNINQNLIRNNIIYTAYCSIRNSVICLIVIFILTILPFETSNNDSNIDSHVQYENICFGIDATNWLIENKNNNIYWDKIFLEYFKIAEDGVTKNIYDKENQIVVVVKRVDDFYIIDDIISNINEIE